MSICIHVHVKSKLPSTPFLVVILCILKNSVIWVSYMRIHLFVSCTHIHSIFNDLYLLGWLFLKHIYECHDILMLDKSPLIKMEATHKHRCLLGIKPQFKQTNRKCQVRNNLSSKGMCSVLIAAEYLYHLNTERAKRAKNI